MPALMADNDIQGLCNALGFSVEDRRGLRHSATCVADTVCVASL
jgi:hypothetical protein